MEVCRLPFEPRHDFLHFVIFVQLFPSEMFIQVKKKVEMAVREVRTVRRMVLYIPLERFRFVFFSSVNILGTRREHNFLSQLHEL